MTNQDNHPKDGTDLRQKAEALARERAARTPEDRAALSPEEMRKMLHELRVHQIELEAQNEIQGGLMFKIKNDPRITNVGKVLRKISFDELYNLPMC